MSRHKDEKRPHFVTSDWHIGHENSLKFDNRPFRDLNHMHRVLVNNFNACVPKNGVTYFLGDVGLCKGELLAKIINKLNGTKILVLGNHDKGMNAMYKLGFDMVMNGAMIIIAKEFVTMTHCPLKGVRRERTDLMEKGDPEENWHGEKKYHKYTIPDFGQFHLHGHIHSPNGGKSTKTQGRQFDVGLPANQYRPVSFSEIESWIAKTLKAENS